jgi:transposase-like protein
MKETQVTELKGHRRFDETFKRHAVELSLRTERTVKAVAEELGISPHRLYAWRLHYAPKPSGLEQAKPDRTLEQVDEENWAITCRGAAAARTGDRTKKSLGILSEKPERYAQIKAMKAEHNIGMLCELLGVWRSGYYRWQQARPSRRQSENASLAAQIARFYRQGRGNYGAPRIVEDLREAGSPTSRRRCAQLMKQLGVRGRNKHRPQATHQA